MRKTLFFMSFLLLAACNNDETQTDTPTKPPQPGNDKMRVNIVSRADDVITAEVLNAGLFMVNYMNGEQDDLLSQSNYVNNLQLTYKNGQWLTSEPIYWNDMNTKADFYAYAPYIQELSDARKMPFSVQSNQNSQEAFAMSDFLWGTIKGQSPIDTNFDLVLTHQLSRLTVAVTAEAGFDEGELQASDVSVVIGGTKISCVIDLYDGALALTGTAQDVTCMNNGDLTYTAILLPQQIPFANLIQIDWRGNKYVLQNSFTLEAQRQYTLTVKLKKTKSGFDIGIEGWDILPEDFGGIIGGN